MDNLKNWALGGLYLLIFLLPWQTRWIFSSVQINGQPWEYGQLSLYATQLLLLAIVILTLLTKPDWKLLKKWWPLNLLELLALLSALWSSNPSVSFYQASLIVSASLLGECLIFLRPTKLKLLSAITAAGLVQGLLAIQQFVNQKVFALSWLGLASHSASLGSSIIQTGQRLVMRSYGSLPHPNILAGWLALAWLCGLIIRLRLVTKKTPLTYRLSLDFSLVVILFALILTFSRSAWLAAGLATLWLLIVATKKINLKQSLIAATIIIVTTIILALPYWSIISSRVSAPVGANISALEKFSYTDRLQTIKNGWQIFTQAPIFGVGIGNSTAIIAQQLQPTLLVKYAQPAHFTPLAVADELGIIGLIIVGIFLWLWRPKQLLSWYAPLLAIPLISGLFDHYWFTLWAGLSLGILILILANTEQDETEG